MQQQDHIVSHKSEQTIDQVAPADPPQIRHFGSTLPIGWTEDGQPKYLLGPHYTVFLGTLLVTSIIAIWMGVSLIIDAHQNKVKITLILILSIGFYIYAYIKVGFSNPGLGSTLRLPSEDIQRHHRYCAPCKAIRGHRTVHCYSCDVCIRGYDHHCPWIGKCVGQSNMCAFKMFLFATMLAIISLSLCIMLGAKPDNAHSVAK